MADKIQSGKPEILLVDDNPKVLRGFIKLFQNDYHVSGVSSGHEALAQVNELTHCVVLDVKMGGLNGFQTYKRIGQTNPATPIIFHTAFQSEHDLIEVINKFQPFGYVKKDQDPSILVVLVDKAVRNYRLYLENLRIREELEDANSLLRIVLRNIENEKQEYQKGISTNLNTLVVPYLEELEKHVTDVSGQRLCELIRENLFKITRTLAKSEIFYDLTRMETKVAKLITHGVTSKKIAVQLNITVKAVEYHRSNLRKKLGLNDQQIDMKEILSDIFPRIYH